VKVKDDEQSQVGVVIESVLYKKDSELTVKYLVEFPDGEGEFGEGELEPQPGMKILSVDYL
jgi:hypothetical protein